MPGRPDRGRLGRAAAAAEHGEEVHAGEHTEQRDDDETADAERDHRPAPPPDCPLSSSMLPRSQYSSACDSSAGLRVPALRSCQRAVRAPSCGFKHPLHVAMRQHDRRLALERLEIASREVGAGFGRNEQPIDLLEQRARVRFGRLRLGRGHLVDPDDQPGELLEPGEPRIADHQLQQRAGRRNRARDPFRRRPWRRRAAPCGARAGARRRSASRARVAADSGAGSDPVARLRMRRASSSSASTSSRSVVIWIEPSAARGHWSFGRSQYSSSPLPSGIAQVERFADAVIRGAVERHVRVDQAAQRVGERRAIGIADRRVIQARRWRRRGAVAALPGVQADVVVIAAGAEERGRRADAGGHLEPEHALVERERAVEVGDFQVDVPDVDAWIDGVGHAPSSRQQVRQRASRRHAREYGASEARDCWQRPRCRARRCRHGRVDPRPQAGRPWRGVSKRPARGGSWAAA